MPTRARSARAAGAEAFARAKKPVAATCVEINQCVGCTDNFSLSHVSAMTRPCWLRRAARNRHRHDIEQASIDGVEGDETILHERAVKF